MDFFEWLGVLEARRDFDMSKRKKTYAEHSRTRDRAGSRKGMRDKMKLKQPPQSETKQVTLSGEEKDKYE